MAQHQLPLPTFFFLQLLVPCLAFEFSDIDTQYYIIGGVGAGAVVLAIVICCCCCCCRKKKSTYEEPHHHQSAAARRQEPRQVVVETEFRRNESQRSSSAPPARAPLVRTESDQRRDAQAEHRRRLDAILTSQASTAHHRLDYIVGDAYNNDQIRSQQPQQSTPRPHVPTTNESHLSSRQYRGDMAPPPGGIHQTDLHDRGTIPDKSTHPHPHHHHEDEDRDNIIASFERIQPPAAVHHGQKTRKERELPVKSPPIEDQPEFMGIKLKPIVLNKAGGTYIPPEDF